MQTICVPATSPVKGLHNWAYYELREAAFFARHDMQGHHVEYPFHFDKHDNLFSTIIVSLDDDGVALGGLQVRRLTRSSPIFKHWPRFFNDRQMPVAPYLEVNNFCIDANLDPAMRQHVADQLIRRTLGFAYGAKFTHLIGVVPPRLWGLSGAFRFSLEGLNGDHKMIEGVRAAVAIVDVRQELKDRGIAV